MTGKEKPPQRVVYPSLREFLARLEAEGELIRVKQRVSPILEISELADRMAKSKDGGKALLFESVEGSNMPVLINAFGSYRRLQLALGYAHIDEIGDEIQQLMDLHPPETLSEKLKVISLLLDFRKFPPRVSKRGTAPCQEVVKTGKDIDLNSIPVIKCWPQDAERFITFPAVITKSFRTGKRNVGIYRLQIYDARTTAMHWHIHKDGAHFFSEYRKAKKRMEVAAVIGTDPAVMFAASAPLPTGVDELLLAGFIRRKGVELVKCKTVDLEVPATAEIVLEGYVDPDELRVEGPFGDHTGYYSLAGEFPVFHVTALTHRRNPIYSTIIVGKPPMEDCYLGKMTERTFIPLLRSLGPEIRDMDLPWEGVFHNCVLLSIEKRYPNQARKIMNLLWGSGQMSFAKMIFIVDDTVDVHDYNGLLTLLLNRLEVPEDLFLSEGILDELDHSTPTHLYGSKIGVDLTAKIPGERGYREKEGKPVRLDSAGIRTLLRAEAGIREVHLPREEAVRPLCIAAVDKTDEGTVPELIQRIKTKNELQSISIWVFVDPFIAPSNAPDVAWKFFNNVDPNRDIRMEGDRLFMDATNKITSEKHPREWPDEISMSEEIKKRVEPIWEDLKKRFPDVKPGV